MLNLQITLYFVYLAIATLFASFFEVAMFMWSGAHDGSSLLTIVDDCTCLPAPPRILQADRPFFVRPAAVSLCRCWCLLWSSCRHVLAQDLSQQPADHIWRAASAGQRQTARLRQRYLEAALTQDVAYYDKDATTGDILSGLNDDCTAVQNAISEKGAWRDSACVYVCGLHARACCCAGLERQALLAPASAAYLIRRRCRKMHAR